MITYNLEDILNSTDRHKLYSLISADDKLLQKIHSLQANSIQAINIGKELSSFIDGLEDYSYLGIEVFDFTIKILDKHKSKINNTGNEVVAIYNFGILLEPALELNAVQLLKDFSKTSALIIIWENQIEIPNYLNWPTQQNHFFLDFTETPLKTLEDAV